MDKRWPPYHAIGPRNLRDAKLHATRTDMIAALPIRRGGKVAEIGVWRGAWSRTLVEHLRPRQFHAFDLFDGHTVQDWNGTDGAQLFANQTHRQFYEREMAAHRDILEIVEGSSLETLRNYTDKSFDLVYIDGNHEHAFVESDAAFAVQMVKDDGVLVFNDYMMTDANGAIYGVVPVVNTLATVGGWDIVGLALDSTMHCDVALQKQR